MFVDCVHQFYGELDRAKLYKVLWVAVAALVVIAIWGPGTLARCRTSPAAGDEIPPREGGDWE
jgi:hypothetical protein